MSHSSSPFWPSSFLKPVQPEKDKEEAESGRQIRNGRVRKEDTKDKMKTFLLAQNYKTGEVEMTENKQNPLPFPHPKHSLPFVKIRVTENQLQMIQTR